MAAHRAIRYAALGMVAGLMAAAQTAEASLVVYEGFQYNTGTTGSAANGGTGDNGGTGWATGTGSGWSSGGTITSPGLEASPQAANDNAATLEGAPGSGGDALSRSISTGSMTTLNGAGTYYVSYLFNLQYSDRNAAFDLALNNSNGSVLEIGVVPDGTNNTSGDFNIYSTYGSPTVVSNSNISPYTSAPGTITSSTNIASKTTFLLVVAIDPTAGTASLYINPGSTQPAQADGSLTGISAAQLDEINSVELFAGDGGNQNSDLEFDEIKMGTAFADVAAPEPATAGFLALSTAALMMRRRRRQRDNLPHPF